MKVKTKKNESNFTIINRLLFCLFIFLMIFLIKVNAQTSKPTPTPELPVVVSRDSDLDRTTRIIKEPEANEIVRNGETIKLPKNNTPTTEKTDAISQKQKKMMLYLDLLNKVEQRAANLQKQLFDLLEKQNSLNTKIKQLDYLLRPEVISSQIALTGSLRPEDLREQRKQSLELEKENLESLLQRLNARRSSLEESVRKSDILVEKIRVRFDKILDEALAEDEELF